MTVVRVIGTALPTSPGSVAISAPGTVQTVRLARLPPPAAPLLLFGRPDESPLVDVFNMRIPEDDSSARSGIPAR